jgi:prepilin peptidase CpaA
VTLAAAPTWCLALLAALLLAAAVEDAVRLKISNLTNLAVLLLGVAAMTLVGFDWSMWENLAVFFALLLGGTLLFASGKLGGGDVKLLAACGLWFSLTGALWMLLYVAIAGGVLALVIILVRMMFGRSKEGRAPILKRSGGIPYGVAIAAGVALALWTARPAVPAIDPLAIPVLPRS